MPALAELGVDAMLLIALAGCLGLYAGLVFLQAHSPKFSIPLGGPTIEIGAIFDGPMRIVESWMHDIEGAIAFSTHLSWIALQDTWKFLAYLAGFSPLESRHS